MLDCLKKLFDAIVGLGKVMPGAFKLRGMATANADLKRENAERVQAEQRLRDSEARKIGILETALDCIITMDRDGKIVDFNPAAEKTFGYTRDAAVGRELAELIIPPALRQQHRQGLARFLATGEGPVLNRRLEMSAHRADGTDFPAELTVSVTYVAGRPFFTGYVRDISNRKQYEAELRQRADALEAAKQDLERANVTLRKAVSDLEASNRELAQFAYVASHDLKEPLRMVASYTQLLFEDYAGRLDAEADKYIHYARDGALRMQSLIDDLLAYSRVAKEGAPTDRVELEDVVNRALCHLDMTIQEKHACVQLDPLPAVMGNQTQLLQLFQNLISNALKFSGPNDAVIKVWSCERDTACEVVVEDNGIGIEPEHRERIFGLFQRLHTRDEYPGTGIGLAICKKIVQRHGGDIWAESKPDRGATFHFTLPLAAAAQTRIVEMAQT